MYALTTFSVLNIMKIINKAVDKVRKQEVVTNPILIKSKYVLLKNESNLTVEQQKKREENPQFDTYLGVELLRHIFQAKEKQNELWQTIHFDFRKVIIFSVVNNKDIYEELISFGIPEEQILYKPSSDLDTLAEAIEEMESRERKGG